MVRPERVSDEQMTLLAREICKRSRQIWISRPDQGEHDPGEPGRGLRQVNRVITVYRDVQCASLYVFLQDWEGNGNAQRTGNV